VAALLTSGCASLPRIDPSGRRFLVWPERQTTTVAPSLATPGNVTVPPVFAGTVPPPALPPMPGAPAGPVTTTALSPVDEQLTITPSRVLAPVGSEVILKAGVCYKDGYLRTNRRIEWMLGQEGAGQFVTVGERGEMDFMRLPWERPNKIDNAYAVGYTTPFNVCLRRGTDDTTDDVQVRTGEAWVTVSSASEGVSYVTATAPETGNWEARRNTAAIYWVDAQWQLPPPTALQLGQGGVLTTTVTRKTDGAPLGGWLVRYEVTRGDTARLGYESGQVSEVTTDASGRAQVQVSPTDDQPGTAQVKVTVIRPASSAPMPAPRLELGGGETIVSWTPSAMAPIGPPISGGITSPPISGGTTTTPPAPFEPPPSGNSGGTLGTTPAKLGPRIELVLRRSSTAAVRVGDPIPVTIELLNTGDQPTQNMRLAVEFDRGLSSPQDTMGRYRLERGDLPSLAPGESSTIDLDFSAVQVGQQCYRVQVTADGMASAADRQCITVENPAAAARPKLRIQTALDAVREVGQKLNYIVTVYNDGSAPATNLAIEVLSDPQLVARQATSGSQPVSRGVRWEGESIPAGGSASFDVEFDSVAQTDQAKVTAYVLFSESDYIEKTDAVEIRPARPAGVTPAPTPTAPRGDLEGVLSSSANPAKVGQPATLSLAITNLTAAAMSNVQYRLVFETNKIQPTVPTGARLNQNTIEFLPIATLAAGESHRIAIPYTPIEQGVTTVWLEMRGGAAGATASAQESISISPR
jgi:hypothetical protein